MHKHDINPTTPPPVEVRNLWVTRDEVSVLEGVNFKVRAGQLVALIGPNGSGKTTLLRALLGLQKIDRGEVVLFGSRLKPALQPGGQSDLRQALKRVGYVPQRFDLERSFILSVREFLCLRLRETSGWFWHSRKQIDAILEPHLAAIGIEGLLNRPLAQLSGGQLQRVLIAFSLLHKPDLLLLDEPTAGVDMPGELTFYDLIAEIKQRHHLTVILVSHDLSMVYRHADWVYALNRTICCEGSPEQIMNAESLKVAYGVHVSPYHHHHGH